MRRSFLRITSAVALAFLSGTSFCSAETTDSESPVYCAATTDVECVNGELSAAYSAFASGPCGDALRAHCRVQFKKQLNDQISELTDKVNQCNTLSSDLSQLVADQSAKIRLLKRRLRIQRQ